MGSSFNLINKLIKLKKISKETRRILLHFNITDDFDDLNVLFSKVLFI